MKHLIPVILAGGSLLSALATAIAQANGLFKGYAWLVPYLYALSVALIVLAGATASISRKREPEKHEQERPTQAAASVASLSQSSSPVTIYNSPTFTNAPSFEQNQSNRDVGASPAPASNPQPNIQFVETKPIEAYVKGEKFYETSRGLGDFHVTIACFRNDAVLGRSIHQPQVTAHILYKDASGSEITDVPSGIWLEEYEGHSAFTVGRKKCLIVFMLSNQGTLKKLWKESYTTEHSWMSGGPSFRIRDERISGQIASVEIRLLVGHSGTCVMQLVLKAEPYGADHLPKLEINNVLG
jgi:hypothetical protein